MANLQVVDVLETALAAFGSNGENWWNGRSCNGSLCTQTAITAKIGTMEGREILQAYFGFPNFRAVQEWNDEPGRTWPEIRAAYEKAIVAAKKKG